ncbi:ABC transporter permease [Streptomyces sp. ISL-99]|uniref:ABC transporter permease n=1 Tax=Streptomyces sp. ISL-99 TaxID=2819193 RepID=UPI0027E50139|nr:ABC transporter permease [Streptomyces sp. ISL-99]
MLQRSDPYGSKAFTRVFIAKGADSREHVPPGISKIPGPGEVWVSPRVHALLRDEPAVKGLLPGREKGVIGASGLAHPDELYAYIGTTHEQIADEARVLKGFGYGYAPYPAVEPSTLTNLRFALGTLVLLPLGLSVKGTQRVNAAETVVAALLGALLGLGEYWALNQVMSRTGLPGLKWYPGDGALSTTTIAICLIGCPALAWFVGRASARDAAANPLAVRRTAAPKPPSKWGGLLLVTGLGIVTGYCATGLTTHPASNTGVNALLVPAGVLLTGIGLVLTLPLISFTLARRVARSTQSLTLNLAMRRNEVEPGSTMRVVTGLVLLVYAASLAQGILIELKQVTRPHAPAQDYAISLSGLTAKQQLALADVPGVRAHALTVESWADPNQSGSEVQPWATALVATCAQLAAFVQDSQGCVDGKVLRLVDPNSSTDPGVGPGTSFLYQVREGGKSKTLDINLPSAQITYKAYAPSAVGSAAVLVPPSALPAQARPQSAQFVLTSDSDPEAVRQVLDGIGSIAPTAEIDTIGININGLQQIIVIQTLLALGMIMGLVIGVAAFLVSVTDRAVERRAQVTAITLIGARARTMRAVQCAQVVLPLSIGLALALVAGKLAESSYLITGGGEVFWDISGIPLLAIATAGVVAAAAAGSLPLVGRRINPELIRRD